MLVLYCIQIYTRTTEVDEKASSMGWTTPNPADVVTRTLKQASVSLTVGVFLGSAVTTGVAFGLAAAWFANERVLCRLRDSAFALAASARDHALSTREGQALQRALLAAPGAVVQLSTGAAGHGAQGSGSRGKRLEAVLCTDENLPAVAPPGGHYLPWRQCGSIVYLSGYTSRRPDGTVIRGPCADAAAAGPRSDGGWLDAAAGAEAARTCALGHLAILESHCGGLDNVHRILKVVVFVAGAPTPDMKRRSPPMSTSAWFTESPAVADGYTDLMIAVLGDEAGAHARSAVCVASLPGGAAVEVEAIVEVRDPGLVKR